MGKHLLIWIAVSGVACCCIGCERGSSDDGGGEAEQGPLLTLITPGALAWTREAACEKLADEETGVSAAVRLAQLSEASPLCLPAELGDDLFSQLRLRALDDQNRVFGIADAHRENCLRAPVIINVDGQVTRLAAGVEEEVLRLHLADDPDIFPHVLLYPDRVLIYDQGEFVPAIVLAPDQRRVRFLLRRERGFPYVSLTLTSAPAREVTRYLWDPYEFAFMGPAVDALPDPPGGKFEVDLESSSWLVPLGGELPEPKPIDQVPPEFMNDELWDDGLLPA
jgi:hypothetical protein